jgi:hypothetical protein
MNGTTNYMLCKMEDEGAGYAGTRPHRQPPHSQCVCFSLWSSLSLHGGYGVAGADALKEAQELGFAEADPTADVEGHDVQAKIALLAKVLACPRCCSLSLLMHIDAH